MRKLVFIIISLILLLGIGGLIWVRHISAYTPEKFRAIADSSIPLRNALERFKRDQGHYPTAVTNLIPAYLQIANASSISNPKDWAGWEYLTKQTDGYELFYQIDWDGGIWLEHSAIGSNQWSYSSSGQVTDLTKTFEQK